MQKIVPGKYSAVILDYGVKESSSGALQLAILLQYRDAEGDYHEITWFGSLKEGQAREITMKTLLNCGLQGNDIAQFGEGVPSNLLDVNTPVTIAVIENDYQGKKSMRVQWIGKQGGGGMDKKLDPNSAKAKLAALNLKGSVVAARQETGIKDEPRKAPVMREPGEDDFDDIFGT